MRLLLLLLLLAFPASAQIPTFSTGEVPGAAKLNSAFAAAAAAGHAGAFVISADTSGATDAAPAFRAAFASNRYVIVPPGTYRFASTVSPPCCAFDNVGVLVQGITNFVLEGYGATILIDPSIALSSAFHFDQDSHFIVRGLTIQGSRSGLSAGQENAGITLSSSSAFKIEDIHFSGNFGGNGAAFAGDWIADGTIQNIQLDAVGQCFDFAFIKSITFRNFHAYGADTAGLATPGHVGTKCMSIIYDGPNAGTNNSGVAITGTSGVNILDNYVTNFQTGAYLTTGQNYMLSGNHWDKNPGAGSSLGIGVLISYINGGSFSSVNIPPGNITINGDLFTGNGAVAAGGGVMLDPIAISNSDVIANLLIQNSVFDNNTAAGIQATAANSLSNMRFMNNSYSGGAQTQDVTFGLLAVTSAYTASNQTKISGAPVLDNNVAFQSRDNVGSPQPLLGLSPSNITFIRPGSSSAYTALQDYTGTTLLTAGAGGIQVSSSPILDNNLSIQFRDHLGAAQPVLGMSGSDITFIRPGSSAAYTVLQDYTGATNYVLAGAGVLLLQGIPLCSAASTGVVCAASSSPGAFVQVK